jgi:hypothetical protein
LLGCGKNDPGPGEQDPRGADREIVLEAVLRDLLTHPMHSQVIDDYGVPGAKEVALAIDSKVPWPEAFAPSVPSYKVHLLRVDDVTLDAEKPALACIELRKFQFDPKRDKYDGEPLGGPIELGIFTSRGSKGGGAVGGCTVWYDYRRVASKWEIVFAGVVDP